MKTNRSSIDISYCRSSDNGTGMLASPVNVAGWSSVNPGTVLAVLLILLCVIFLKLRHNQSSLGRVPKGLVRPPCLPSLPFVGSAPFMITSLSDVFKSNFLGTLPEFFLKKSKQLGNVIAFYSMSRYTVVLIGRKTIYDAFVRKGVAFAHRKPSVAEQRITNLNLIGITSCPYTAGFVKRRTITLSLLKDLGYGKGPMELHIHGQLVHFTKDADRFQGKSFDPTSLVNHFVTGVIFAILFGRQFDADDPLCKLMEPINNGFVAINSAVYEMVPLMRWLPQYSKLSKFMVAIYEKLFELIRKEINHCLSDGKDDTFTYKYAEKEGSESVYSDEFLYIVRDLMGAGSDTSKHTIRWILFMLANHDEIQQRLHKEVDDYYGTSPRLPSIDDVSKLPLVAATLLETMRIETLTPFAAPHQTLCDTEVNGYFIPKGTMVLPNIYSGHMDPDDWAIPGEFKPDRFIDSEGQLVGQKRVIAFSMGKRACPGEQLAKAEMFIFLANLLRHFHVLPPEGQSSVITERLYGFLVEPSSFAIRLIRRQEINYTANI